MYYIINCGGKQHKVSEGSKIVVNRLPYSEGEEFTSDKVFMYQAEEAELLVGDPLIKGASYAAKVEKNFKGDKVIVFKKKRRKNYRRKKGHRQELSEVKILSVNIGK